MPQKKNHRDNPDMFVKFGQIIVSLQLKLHYKSRKQTNHENTLR